MIVRGRIWCCPARLVVISIFSKKCYRLRLCLIVC
ncbi:hypothetical protein [Escherichia phage vB_EcoS_ULIM2]|nr:hypothetical protein [Escherichia phage vB_EcoS_ULIM2]